MGSPGPKLGLTAFPASPTTNKSEFGSANAGPDKIIPVGPL
jgi:hypothetical protein